MHEASIVEYTLRAVEKDAVIHCEGCGKNMKIDDFSIEQCPCCGSPHIKVRQGNELMISSFRGA